METVDEFRESPDWELSTGLPPTKVHFREVGGTRHAVCDPSTGECEIHEDAVNPHDNLLGHLVSDAPEVLTGIAVTAAGLWWWKKRRFLPWR